MILSDREGQALIVQGRIGLDPCPLARYWSATTVDLTLDAQLTPWDPVDDGGSDTLIRPWADSFNVDALIARFTRIVDCTEGYVVDPGRFVLGWTIERLRLPETARIAARVEGKSSLARIGLGIHVTAPIIHPGFGAIPGGKKQGSSIRLEIWNAGPLKIELKKGMSVCQLMFEEVHGTPLQGYAGQFVVQGPRATGKKRGSGR